MSKQNPCVARRCGLPVILGIQLSRRFERANCGYRVEWITVALMLSNCCHPTIIYTGPSVSLHVCRLGKLSNMPIKPGAFSEQLAWLLTRKAKRLRLWLTLAPNKSDIPHICSSHGRILFSLLTRLFAFATNHQADMRVFFHDGCGAADECFLRRNLFSKATSRFPLSALTARRSRGHHHERASKMWI